MIVQIIPLLAHNSQYYQNLKSLELGIVVKRVVIAILVLLLLCRCCSPVVQQGCCSFAYSFAVRVCYWLLTSKMVLLWLFSKPQDEHSQHLFNLC